MFIPPVPAPSTLRFPSNLNALESLLDVAEVEERRLDVRDLSLSMVGGWVSGWVYLRVAGAERRDVLRLGWRGSRRLGFVECLVCCEYASMR